MRNRTDRNEPTPSQGLACGVRHHTPRGFALVVTVSLLVLLTIIALGLLSLSTISLRSGSREHAKMAAQANARMALMLAIGELQKQLGPDQRISASGEILDNPKTPLINEAKNPHWTGVWDSWIAGPVAAAPTKPGYPNTDSHHQTIGTQPDDSMRPKYAEKNKHFRAWLLSLDSGLESNMNNGRDLTLTGTLMPTEDETSVQLVAEGSLGDKPEDYVSAQLIKVEPPAQSTASMSGRYGWWIGDESQKARISNNSYAEGSLTSAEKIFRSQAPDSTGTSTVKGLETLTAAQDKKLAGLPSLCTLDVVQDSPPGDALKPSENFHHVTTSSYQVLADVREGGLKRDLSTLLERPIKLEENTDEFMLYAFDDARWTDPTRPHSRVPIQDLAAYYQLYEDDPSSTNGRQGGVAYDSSELADSIQLQTADYDGVFENREKFLRDYTGLYRNPVPIKVQFLMAVGAEEITTEEQTTINNNITATGNFRQPLNPADSHKLKIGLIPVVTLWNPFSVPIVMRTRQVFTMNTPPFAFRWRKYRADGTQFNNDYFSLGYCMAGNSQQNGAFDFNSPRIFIWIFSKTQPIVFKPGEVKLFSMPSTDINMLKDGGEKIQFAYGAGGQADLNVEPVNEWDPFGFFVTQNGAVAPSSRQPDAYWFNRLNGITPNTSNDFEHIVFGPNDKFSIEIVKEDVYTTGIGRNIGRGNETHGGGFNFHIEDRDYFGGYSNLRRFQFLSRYGGVRTAAAVSSLNKFNGDMISLGFPGGTSPINHDTIGNAIPGSVIIGASDAGEVKGVLEFSLAAGCEVATSASGGYGGGRKIAMRPFLHGSSMASPFIDQLDKPSLYNYGWDWQVGRINDIEDSIIQGDPGTGNGYFGGGYTVEAGTTHVVQQDIPVVPPISIAALSHARLGGFGLTNATLAESNQPSLLITWNGSSPSGRSMRDPTDADAFQRVTAAGQGGLAPHVMQAIGNSYAHPNIPADKAFSTWKRYFEQDLMTESETEKVTVPFVDHSYLANKALWDEFFFSSITPQPSSVEVFGGNRTLNQVTEDFFFSNKPLPNRRMVPVKTKLSESALSSLLGQSQDFTNGMADKIAAHLMVEGGFNINSTSVEAWKVLLTSLKGKPVAYLNGGKEPSQASPTGTPVNPGALPAAQPIASGSITGPNTPPEQWKGGRELSDTEIGQLAKAIVKQVKLRGPFLSMSEFVNRRLDSSNTDEMALKGALQAALDDPTVSINANFRTTGRMLDSETSSISGFAFADAAKGPIAYGSAPYIDQADVLRNFAAQLAPRGDTFVIRTYGDALDSSGKIVARAWCEAVVQRVPEYTDPLDEPHVKQADLQSASNKTYGRKINMVSFRWLNPNEV